MLVNSSKMHSNTTILSYFISTPNKTKVSTVVFTDYDYFLQYYKRYKLMDYNAIVIKWQRFLQTLPNLQIEVD